MSVLLQTSFGDIVIDLFTQKAPNACLNFIKLCKIKYYNNSLFLEVQKNYVTKVRTDQPTTIWKQAGQNLDYFKDQIDVERKINQLGLIVTANSGPNLNNSDFFITLTKANIASLAGKHTVFGRVQEGFDVLKKINDTYVDSHNRPQMNIRILHTFVIDDPFDEIGGLQIPRSPSPPKETDRLEAIEHLQMLEKCKTQNEIIQATRQQKAKKQAMTLQILGDLPDSSLKPPQNVLFICKLNPITKERDLEVIFSRFGPIKSVEIVRDWKTGQSLQYGFIQFDNISSCEEAYLKMNNVLIDDRRIQVDFSQSVSKMLHKNRTGGILHSKPKFGQSQQRRRELLPKSYTQGKNTQPKYDYIITNPSSKRQQRTQTQQILRQDDRRQMRQLESRKRSRSVQKDQKREKSKKDKEKKKKRSDSDSYSREKKNKRKYERQSSKEKKGKVKAKKHRKQSNSSSD